MIVTPPNNYYQHLAKEAQTAKAVIAASSSVQSTTSTTSNKNNTIDEVNIVRPSVTLKNAMATCIPFDSGEQQKQQLHKGILVRRITSRGAWKHRVVTLSHDQLAFFVTHKELPSNLSSTVASALPIPLWTPSKGLRWSNDDRRYIRHLDIADIDAWQVGVIGTPVLEYAKAKGTLKEKHLAELVTLFHHGFKPICFRIPDAQHRKAFVEALPLMKNRYNLMVSFIAREQVSVCDDDDEGCGAKWLVVL